MGISFDYDICLKKFRIDVIHHVEGPITPRDQNHTVLMQKVRELCAALAGTSASTWLCVFERCLQREVAQIREEFDIEGPRPEQFDQLTRRKDIRAVCRRGGLTTLRFAEIIYELIAHNSAFIRIDTKICIKLV